MSKERIAAVLVNNVADGVFSSNKALKVLNDEEASFFLDESMKQTLKSFIKKKMKALSSSNVRETLDELKKLQASI